MKVKYLEEAIPLPNLAASLCLRRLSLWKKLNLGKENLIINAFIGESTNKTAHQRSWLLQLRKAVVNLLGGGRTNAWLSTDEKERCQTYKA